MKHRSPGNKSFRKIEYVYIILCIIFFLAGSFLLKELYLINGTAELSGFRISSYTLRGIIMQLQMLISVYLTLRERKTGFFAALVLNIYSFFSLMIFFIKYMSTEPFPGFLYYFGVILIISLINNYKRKKDDYLKEIETQSRILEEAEKKLHHMAFYDSLTHLPNRDLFMDRLEHAIYKAKRTATLIGVMFIDLDTFKTVNDILGHTAGDQLLKHVADRLTSILRKSDTVSRFGGDEFLIMINDIGKVEDIHKITNKIMDVFKNPVTIQNSEFYVTASAGVAVYPIDGEDAETLIKNADFAMYSAKSKGKNQSAFCSPDMKNDVMKKMKLTNNLYRALEKNELFLHYQPQVKVETGKITGFEALLRWNNEEYGDVPPELFIPLAEITGLIKPIGLWVFKTVCELCKICRLSFGDDFRISINISIEQLEDKDFINQIRELLHDTGTDAANIQIEIKESVAFKDEPFLLQHIHDLKNIGFTIAIDGFGTGYSSFSRLKVFPIDLIKIDMEFVRGISAKSQKDKAITKSIIQISKNLGIKALAVGVETEEEFMFLKEHDCDEIQGFYFFEPMPYNELRAFLNESNLQKNV